MHVNRSELDQILGCLFRAERRFLEDLQASDKDQDMVEGIDRLEYALEYAYNWDHDMPICPKCGGIYCWAVNGRDLQCLDCDSIWEHAFDRHEFGGPALDVEAAPSFDGALDSLRDAAALLEREDNAYLKKSGEFLHQSLQFLGRVSCRRGIRRV